MLISIVVPTYFEEDTIEANYKECIKALKGANGIIPELTYEYIVIDNASEDNTVDKALGLKSIDKNIKVYVNDKNYGPILSPYAGLLEAQGDYVILIAADLQEPPEIIKSFLAHVQGNYDAIIGIKKYSMESRKMWLARGLYYQILLYFGVINSRERFSGFGCYSRTLIEKFRKTSHYEPSIRSLVSKYATNVKTIEYTHAKRQGGQTSYNLYLYLKEAIKNLARNSNGVQKITGKLAIASMIFSIIVCIALIAMKAIFWNSFAPGLMTVFTILMIMNSLTIGLFALVLDKIEKLTVLVEQKDKEYVLHSKVYL